MIATKNTGNTGKFRIPGKTKEDLSRLAYKTLEGIEFLEMNDGNRLGYHLYVYLSGEGTSISEAIYETKARTKLSAGELERIITDRLVAEGLQHARSGVA